MKQDFNSVEVLGQRVLLIASELFPKDERKFFIQNVTQNMSNLSTEIIAKIFKSLATEPEL